MIPEIEPEPLGAVIRKAVAVLSSSHVPGTFKFALAIVFESSRDAISLNVRLFYQAGHLYSGAHPRGVIVSRRHAISAEEQEADQAVFIRGCRGCANLTIARNNSGSSGSI